MAKHRLVTRVWSVKTKRFKPGGQDISLSTYKARWNLKVKNPFPGNSDFNDYKIFINFLIPLRMFSVHDPYLKNNKGKL